MCEFAVFLNNEVVYKDVIYAKNEGSKVVLKDVFGGSKIVENCRIIEIDVGSGKLTLALI